MTAPQNTIMLGHTVREITSGVVGIATTKTEFLTGNVQFSVQCAAKDNVLPDSHSYDVQQLDFVDFGIASRVTPAPVDVGIQLGEKVKDIVTGVQGIATRKATFMNGCVYFIVVGPSKDEKPFAEDFFDSKRLEVVGNGVMKKFAKKLEALPEPEKKTGGPNTRVMARG